tara:strand:- start:2050 stop:3090 length:1041 start_codon:yes stop_codon:yes gene_type:complete
MVNINLRSTVSDQTSIFCESIRIAENSSIQNTALVELIFLIARYQEEGVKLHPKVYLTSDIEIALKMLPGQVSMKIGESICFLEAVKSSLKKCAPLATNGWCIYVSQNAEVEYAEFGIFRGDTNPTAVHIDKIIMSDDLPFKTIKVHQTATDNVEVRSSEGGTLHISLNHTIEDFDNPLEQMNQLIHQLVFEVKKNKEQVSNYLSRLLNESINKSHGCLIVISKNSEIPSSLVSDGTYLPSPIDFQKLVELSLVGVKEAGNLISMGQLLEGMLNSDGIVIFDNNGQLLAFNCFIPLPEQQVNSTNSIGGARTRAFDALCNLLETELAAIFMKSQDGLTKFKGSSDE